MRRRRVACAPVPSSWNMSSTSWKTRREGGSEVLIRLIAWIAAALGRQFCLLLLFPISGYFFLFDRRARSGIRSFHLNRGDSRWLSVYQTFYVFAVTLLDRVYFAARRFPASNFLLSGDDVFRQVLEREGRCVLIGSHLGSFDVPLFLNESHHIEISVLMHKNQSSRVRSIAGISDQRFDVIETGRPDSMLRAFDRLLCGGVLGILGDRSNGSSDVNVEFMGQQVSLTKSPYVLAYKAESPVFVFFALYIGAGKYEVSFSELTRPEDFLLSQEKFIIEVAGRFARALAHQAQSHPANWFNFFDYFEPPAVENAS